MNTVVAPMSEATAYERWEYLFVDCSNHQYEWRPRYLNGEEFPDWRQTTISSFSNWLGKQGWELVSIATAQGIESYLVTTYRLVFKRRL